MREHVVPPRALVLLFDRDCGLCVATSGWLTNRVPPGSLRAVPLDGANGDERLRLAVRGRDLAASLHVVRHDGSVASGAGAVLAAARLVRGWGLLARLYDHRAGHALLEPAYRLVAANRHRIGRALGLPATCAVPTAGRSGAFRAG